jgi:acyl carrier protein
VPAERELLATLARCHARLTGDEVDLTTIPADCSFLELERHGLSLDSIQLLEMVVLLEEELGCDIELVEVQEDWQTYRWGQFLADLEAAITSAG